MRALIREELAQALVGRPAIERIQAFAVLQEPFRWVSRREGAQSAACAPAAACCLWEAQPNPRPAAVPVPHAQPANPLLPAGPERSIEGGTLTRTMKPRRAEIVKRYSREVAQVEAQLR